MLVTHGQMKECHCGFSSEKKIRQYDLLSDQSHFCVPEKRCMCYFNQLG